MGEDTKLDGLFGKTDRPQGRIMSATLHVEKLDMRYVSKWSVEGDEVTIEGLTKDKLTVTYKTSFYHAVSVGLLAIERDECSA